MSKQHRQPTDDNVMYNSTLETMFGCKPPTYSYLPGLSHRLTALWISPYEVTVKISAMAYHLHLPAQLAIHDILYASLLKPAMFPYLPALLLSLLLALMLLNIKLKTYYVIKLRSITIL